MGEVARDSVGGYGKRMDWICTSTALPASGPNGTQEEGTSALVRGV